MSKKIKALLEDYEPLTEMGKKAKEQLIELLGRRKPNTFPFYSRVSVYTADQIIEMVKKAGPLIYIPKSERLPRYSDKQIVEMYLQAKKEQKQEVKNEVKIQSQKANA